METTELVREFLADRDEPCPGCGYNLRGSSSATCPECGGGLELGLRRVTVPRAAARLAVATLSIGTIASALSLWNYLTAWRSLPLGAFWYACIGYAVVPLLAAPTGLALTIRATRKGLRDYSKRLVVVYALAFVVVWSILGIILDAIGRWAF